MADEKTQFGLLAEFENPQILYTACEKVRDAGYKQWDAYTPFPVHGLDKAMGIPASKVPWVALGGALTGMCTAVMLQWYTSAVEYPLVISGKPLFSWPAFVPITFELSILFGAFGAVLGMLAINGLPKPYHPLFSSERFARVTDDKFFIAIEVGDEKFDAASTEAFLKEIGAVYVEMVAD